MSSLEAVLGIVMLAGLVGVLVPIFPGLILVVGAGLVWAIERGGPGAWAVFAFMAVVGVAGVVASTVVPARRVGAEGAPAWVIVAGSIGLVVGFFVVPIVGALVGFPAGVFVAELARHRHPGTAWRATAQAVRGVGLGIALQLAAGVVMIGAWVVAVLVS